MTTSIHLLTKGGSDMETIVEIFIVMVDELYYEGYAQELQESDPQLFEFELSEFTSQFSI